MYYFVVQICQLNTKQTDVKQKCVQSEMLLYIVFDNKNKHFKHAGYLD